MPYSNSFMLVHSNLHIGNGSEADYTSVIDQSISFTSANRDLTVQITSDNFTELNETFSAVLTSVFLSRTAGGVALELTDQESARLVRDSHTATVNILDDDGISLCTSPQHFIISYYVFP